MAGNKKTALLCVTFLITALGIPFRGYADSSSSNQTSFQEMISKARPGDHLFIPAGVYHEQIRINKPIHLIADGNVVVDGGGKEDVITIAADGVELQGFNIRNSGTDLGKDAAGIKVLSSNNMIVGNHIEHDLHGIYLKESNHNRIEGNKIVGIRERDMNDRGNGIHLFHSQENVLEDNEISFQADGMYFSYSDGNQVNQNFVHDLRYGLHYMYSNDNSFTHNIFTHNIGGAALMMSHNITLKHNEFTEHRGPLGTGIVMNSCDDSLMEDNKISGNTRAMFMDSSNRNIIRSNEIEDNYVGMEIPNSSLDNQIYENHWVGEDVPVLTDSEGKSNLWYNPDSKRGNYWSGAALVDLAGKGISDIPYHPITVQSYLIGQFPDLRFLIDSPVMKLLDFAYHQFPLFSIPGPIDPYPLIPADK